MSIKQRHHSSAFSLIEVLLAVLVLGVALTVFFSAANQGLSFTMQARDYQVYREILRELEFREPLDLENIKAEEITGSFTHEEFGNYQWRRSIESVGKEEDEFYSITTRVWREGQSAEDGESTETFLYQPDALAGSWVREPYEK